tara:strand:- start:417 stop:905 length:489 start_codon:yes stop_codon:yes gene_type:complete
MQEPGTETYILDDNVCITHGSSLNLMSKIGICLQDSDLKDINPTKDWKRWKKCGLQNYYILTQTAVQECAACMRLLYDEQKLIIEYLYTVPDARGLGLGKKLVDTCRFLAKDMKLSLYVLSVEEAVIYWMNLGFIWIESEDDSSINTYTDTFMMRDMRDMGD